MSGAFVKASRMSSQIASTMPRQRTSHRWRIVSRMPLSLTLVERELEEPQVDDIAGVTADLHAVAHAERTAAQDEQPAGKIGERIFQRNENHQQQGDGLQQPRLCARQRRQPVEEAVHRKEISAPSVGSNGNIETPERVGGTPSNS